MIRRIETNIKFFPNMELKPAEVLMREEAALNIAETKE